MSSKNVAKRLDHAYQLSTICDHDKYSNEKIMPSIRKRKKIGATCDDFVEDYEEGLPKKRHSNRSDY